jgi:hypothetical protein
MQRRLDRNGIDLNEEGVYQRLHRELQTAGLLHIAFEEFRNHIVRVARGDVREH